MSVRPSINCVHFCTWNRRGETKLSSYQPHSHYLYLQQFVISRYENLPFCIILLCFQFIKKVKAPSFLTTKCISSRKKAIKGEVNRKQKSGRNYLQNLVSWQQNLPEPPLCVIVLRSKQLSIAAQYCLLRIVKFSRCLNADGFRNTTQTPSNDILRTTVYLIRQYYTKSRHAMRGILKMFVF